MKPFKTLIKYLVWTIKIYISTTYYCTILMQYLSGDSVCFKYLHAICLLTVLYVLILELHSGYKRNAMFMNWHRRVLMWQKFPDAYIDYVFSKSKKILMIKTAHLKNNSFSFRCYFFSTLMETVNLISKCIFSRSPVSRYFSWKPNIRIHL